MWFLVVAMIIVLVFAVLVVLYVAFPHRGEDVPHVPWLGAALRRGVERAPTLDNTSDEPVDHVTDDVDLRSLDQAMDRPASSGNNRPA
jgi:hypothetical protein